VLSPPASCTTPSQALTHPTTFIWCELLEKNGQIFSTSNGTTGPTAVACGSGSDTNGIANALTGPTRSGGSRKWRSTRTVHSPVTRTSPGSPRLQALGGTAATGDARRDCTWNRCRLAASCRPTCEPGVREQPWVKKALSQRVHALGDSSGTAGDLYSAFLACFLVEDTLDAWRALRRVRAGRPSKGRYRSRGRRRRGRTEKDRASISSTWSGICSWGGLDSSAKGGRAFVWYGRCL